jgi:hypothetical protein
MRLVSMLFLLAGAAVAASKDSCVECHTALSGKLKAPVTEQADSVHLHRGFSCSSCHGGDPSQSDAGKAHSGRFTGKIARTAIPGLCASCHSNAALMRKYSPKGHIDQFEQYLTSTHGKRLKAGDTSVATCTDCHGTHNTRDVKHPQSSVHPLHLPSTCARCHSGEHGDYVKSVHWNAVSKRGDLSAPTCASCHGNHGAAPPQVQSVAAVCGSCHVLQEDLFNKSPHQPVFAAMGAAGCTVCHSNHDINRPSTEMLAGKSSVCSQCHDGESAGGKTAEQMAKLIRGLGTALNQADEVLAEAEKSGMEVSEALLQQRDGREQFVKAEVAVHAFKVEAVASAVDKGLAIAASTRKAGEEALRERGVRRVGLSVSLVAIFATIAGLWIAIKSIERRPEQSESSGG